jgi:glycosyltransferase involved in cell wall biosynthesis
VIRGCERVALVHWTMPPTTGGVESHVSDLGAMLAARGCIVTVLTGEPSPAPVAGCELVTLPELRLDRAWAPGTPAVTSALRSVLRDRRPTVVHGHNLHHFNPAPALALNALCQELGFGLHHTFHETWPDVLHDLPVYRAWDGNWAVSRHVQAECAYRIGFRPALLRLPVDSQRFTAGRPPFHGGRLPLMLHPARLLPWKGVHVSVAALARLRDRGYDSVLVITDTQRIADWDGELGDYRRRVCQLIDEYGLRERVRFRGVAYGDMPTLYEQADIVVYPTVGDEPYGLVPLEAMSCGRPVVATRSGGIAETVIDGQTGFLVAREDIVGLADRVAALLDDPALARRMGQAGRERVNSEFSPGPFLDALLHRYAAATAR